MTAARFIRLEGFEFPCLLVGHDGEFPEELVIDRPDEPRDGGKRRVVYRLQPSTRQEAEPVYVEVFDE